MAVSTTFPFPTLGLGSIGQEVQALQERLNQLGFALVPDGMFGPLTKRAVEQFQRNRRLSVDGIVGPQTWNALLPLDRQTESRLRRVQAANLAANRPHATHNNNGEEGLAGQPGNFRKGLEHGSDGFLVNDRHYQSYRDAIGTGLLEDIAAVPTPNISPKRKWESPTAGFVFDLEGPDAQSISIPPAPTLGSDELAAELAEVYAMAALRDTPFANFASDAVVQTWIGRLNQFSGFGSAYAKRPNRCYGVDEIFGPQAGRFLGRGRGRVNANNLFRGVTTGDEVGPLISQFLLIGNPSRGADAKMAQTGKEWTETAGKIRYGAISIDQRLRYAKEGVDFMTDFGDWLKVQNGEDVTKDYEFDYNPSTYTKQGQGDPNEPDGPAYRFILTPRDLATYVHFDQLYQAYLNACLILLERGVPVDPGIQNLYDGENQKGFAQFGGPHILSLLTEVASRALKAVRFQKFNIHNRARPEELGGLMEQLRMGNGDRRLNPLRSTWDTLKNNNALPAGNHLLPMAFPEGSPMHPSYGAGHATVAGACVTILKAFFDPTHQFVPGGEAYEADPTTGGRTLRKVANSPALTVEGELNKVASNISIGRNMAGVHYFSDYLESLRLGELIAIGVLEEQALMYNAKQFPFEMTVPLFDGGTVQIGTLI